MSIFTSPFVFLKPTIEKLDGALEKENTKFNDAMDLVNGHINHEQITLADFERGAEDSRSHQTQSVPFHDADNFRMILRENF